jgi:hypothetical protein
MTKAWFNQKMIEMGHPHPPQAHEFLEILPKPRNVIPGWLRNLRDHAHAYTRSGGSLCITPKPYEGYGWIARSIIAETLQNDTETHGLDQVDPTFSDDYIETNGSESSDGIN